MKDTGLMMLAAAAMLMVGCTEELLDGRRGEIPVILTTAVDANTTTRAATDVLSSTQFGAGETFYAYFPTDVRINDVTSACGTTFTTDGSGGTTPAVQPYFNATANVCAYYPYVTGKQVTNSTTSFSVERDQSTEAGYKKSDLMYATSTITKSGASSSTVLTFGHKMSKIIVNVTLGQGISAVTGVRLVSGSKTVTIANPMTIDESSAPYVGSVSEAAADQISAADGECITLYSGSYTTTTTPLSCAGLIPPQTINGDFLQIITNMGTATYSVSDKTFISGGFYTYNVTVTATSFAVITDITNWDDSETTNLVNFGSETAQMIPEAVDLGLPNGTLWANMNVGSTCETDYGMYFMWGDVVGRSGDNDNGDATDGLSFYWPRYKWTADGGSTFTKYTGSDYTVLQPSDDAATANWGGSWRMPTQAECEALTNTYNTNDWGNDNDTHWKWTWYSDYKGSGHNGYLISYRADVSNTTVTSTLFLPAAGYRNDTYVYDQGLFGGYRSSTLYSDYPYDAYYLSFYSYGAAVDYGNRCDGYSVRPVQSNGN